MNARVFVGGLFLLGAEADKRGWVSEIRRR